MRLNLPGVELRLGRRLSDPPRVEVHLVVTDVKALAHAVRRELELDARRGGRPLA